MAPPAAVILPDRVALRAIVRTFYDYQHMRIQIGNRLATQFRVQLGQDPGASTDELSPDAQKLLTQLKEEYKLLADGLVRADRRRWQTLVDEHRGVISTPEELVLTQQYVETEAHEHRLELEIGALVREFPIWKEFLAGVRGCGPLMSAVVISELDPHKARHPSSFWMYCGLDVGPDGRGRSKRAEHLVERTYTTKAGDEDTRMGITYNPFAKTKLVGVLGSSFLRASGAYRDIYDGYKHRLESHPRYGLGAEAAAEDGATKLHRHRMAIRYAVKMFLLDLWRVWRRLEGLEVGPEYAAAKLGLVHGEERSASPQPRDQ